MRARAVCRGCGRKNVTRRLVDVRVHYNDTDGTITYTLMHRTHCPACRWKAKRSEGRARVRAKHCAVCCKRMTSHRSTRRYCSDACRVQAWRR